MVMGLGMIQELQSMEQEAMDALKTTIYTPVKMDIGRELETALLKLQFDYSYKKFQRSSDNKNKIDLNQIVKSTLPRPSEIQKSREW